MARKSQKQHNIEALGRIRKGITDWNSYYSTNISKHRRMTRAVYEPKTLYDLEEYAFYKQSGRPTLTYNLLQRETNAMTAEFSGNVPHTKVRSDNQDNNQQDEVDLVDKILRTITLDSRSQKAYKKAFKDMIIGGYGAFKVAPDTDRGNPFRDVIKIYECDNPINVGWDPLANEDNKQDGAYCFDLQQMSLKEFKILYPGKAQPKPLVGDGQFKWQTEDNIVLVNWWEKVPYDRNITLLSDGTVLDTDKVEEYLTEKNVQVQDTLNAAPQSPVAPVQIVDQKTVKRDKIKYYRAVYGDILEVCDCSGSMLPWVQMCGNKEIIDGKEVVTGFIEWLISPQMEYNFGANDHVYQVMTKSNAQFMGTKDMIPADQMGAWKKPQQKQGLLIYQKDAAGDKPEVLPQQTISNDSQMVIERALTSFQNISGRFNASLGQQSNEISGTAIVARQRASNINTKDFRDRARLAMETGAMVQLDLIPSVYDTERTMTLLNSEGKEEESTINTSNGNENSIKEGIYSVSVTMGDSFELQQSSNAIEIAKFGQAYPEARPYTADIMASNMDIQNKDKLIERIHRNVIPEIAVQEGSKDPIVIKNAQAKQNNPMAQIQQHAAMLELQKKQLDIQREKQDMVLDKVVKLNEKLDDRLKAVAAANTGNANLMNAQTTQDKAGADVMIQQRKVQAEEDKANLELQTEIVKTIGAVNDRES